MYINILGKPYQVTMKDEDDMPDLLGQAIAIKQQINIRKKLPKEITEETLLHEIMHIINEELVLGLSEEQIARMSVGVYSAGYRK